MVIILVALTFFVCIYLVKAASQLQRDLCDEMGVVPAQEARGFLIGYRVKSDPIGVIHVMSFRDMNGVLLLTVKNTKILFVVPVRNAEQACWYVYGRFTQARRFTVNTMYYSIHFRISMFLVSDRELKREMQLCV